MVELKRRTFIQAFSAGILGKVFFKTTVPAEVLDRFAPPTPAPTTRVPSTARVIADVPEELAYLEPAKAPLTEMLRIPNVFYAIPGRFRLSLPNNKLVQFRDHVFATEDADLAALLATAPAFGETIWAATPLGTPEEIHPSKVKKVFGPGGWQLVKEKGA